MRFFFWGTAEGGRSRIFNHRAEGVHRGDGEKAGEVLTRSRARAGPESEGKRKAGEVLTRSRARAGPESEGKRKAPAFIFGLSWSGIRKGKRQGILTRSGARAGQEGRGNYEL